MNERRDDTTKPAGESRPARAKGRYYYDDATGYETYEPGDDEEEKESEPGAKRKPDAELKAAAQTHARRRSHARLR